MLLGNLLNLKRKKYRNIFLNGISFDTRNIKKKDIFFSIKGNSTSGDKLAVAGTYLHGIFDNGYWRRQWVNLLRKKKFIGNIDFFIFCVTS